MGLLSHPEHHRAAATSRVAHDGKARRGVEPIEFARTDCIADCRHDACERLLSLRHRDEVIWNVRRATAAPLPCDGGARGIDNLPKASCLAAMPQV